MGMVICNADHKKAPGLEVVWGVPSTSPSPAPGSWLCPVAQAAAFFPGAQELAREGGGQGVSAVSVCGNGVFLGVCVCVHIPGCVCVHSRAP